MEQAIIIFGNVVDGCNFIGPFETLSIAIEWAETNRLDDWHVTTLSNPAEFANDRND